MRESTLPNLLDLARVDYQSPKGAFLLKREGSYASGLAKVMSPCPISV